MKAQDEKQYLRPVQPCDGPAWSTHQNGVQNLQREQGTPSAEEERIVVYNLKVRGIRHLLRLGKKNSTYAALFEEFDTLMSHAFLVQCQCFSICVDEVFHEVSWRKEGRFRQEPSVRGDEGPSHITWFARPAGHLC